MFLSPDRGRGQVRGRVEALVRNPLTQPLPQAGERSLKLSQVWPPPFTCSIWQFT